MQSNRSELSHRRQHSDRSSRQWDDSKDRWEERREPHRDNPRDSYHKYHGDGHGNMERMGRSREYSESPKRWYSKDSSSRDWSRQSPVRRRVSSPTSDGAEKKRRRFTGDSDIDYRYRRESPEKTCRLSPDGFSHDHKTEDFKNRKTSPDSRAKPWREEFSSGKHDGLNNKGFSGFYKDKDYRKRRQDSSHVKSRPPDRFSKIYTKTKEGMDSSSTSVYHEEHHRNRGEFHLNGSSKEVFESDVTSADPDQKSSKGFQRFLDVLNKGVNVDVLTKIVTQTSARDVNNDHVSRSSFVSAADRRWSPSCAERQQKGHQQDSCWSGGSHRRASPQPHHRSISPNQLSGSDENALRRNSESLFGSRSKSPSVEKATLTAEDERKHRQMQDVLQAIGVDLGFEELGQMSHRIQERLYGKKDGDRGGKSSREQSTRQPYYSTKRLSRSSSSTRSSLSPLSRDGRMKKDSSSAQRDEVKVQQSVEYGWRMSGSSVQDSEECKATQESAASLFPPNSSYTVTQPPATCVMPTYSPISCSPLPFPALNPVPPPALPPIRPGLFLPSLPPFLSYPHVPPPNIFPPALMQTNHSFPRHTSTPQPQQFSLPAVNTIQALNKTQKPKTQARPRCLQVIK